MGNRGLLVLLARAEPSRGLAVLFTTVSWLRWNERGPPKVPSDSVVTNRFHSARRGGSRRLFQRASAWFNLRSDGCQGITGVAPGIVTTQQRQGFESAFAKKERHTGAGRFVQSGTVNNSRPIRRQPAIPLVNQVGGDENRPGKRARVFPDLVGTASVDQGERMTLVEPTIELLRADRRLGLLN